jgi:hypothetical protein
LWRHVIALPQRGKIVISNRSHYEELLVARVHPGAASIELLLADREFLGLCRPRFRYDNNVPSAVRRCPAAPAPCPARRDTRPKPAPDGTGKG